MGWWVDGLMGRSPQPLNPSTQKFGGSVGRWKKWGGGGGGGGGGGETGFWWVGGSIVRNCPGVGGGEGGLRRRASKGV